VLELMKIRKCSAAQLARVGAVRYVIGNDQSSLLEEVVAQQIDENRTQLDKIDVLRSFCGFKFCLSKDL